MKFSSGKIVGATLALALLAGIAVAHASRRHDGEFMGRHALRFFTHYLDLTAAQQAQIKGILAKDKPAVEPLFRQEMDSHKQMIQLIQSGSFDEAKAQAIAAQSAQIRAQLELQHARMASEAYQVLTPEQKTKLDQFIAKREQRFEQHMREHGDGDHVQE